MAVGYHGDTETLANTDRRIPTERRYAHRLAEKICRVKLYSDIHERACDVGVRLPLGRKRMARLDKIRQAKTLFIHIPKNAGTSVNSLLYGENMRHETARYFHHAAPDLRERNIMSFAIWRDPVERFLSAFDFARQGGGRMVRLHPHFANLYRNFRSLDDALDHVEHARSPYALDHVFRPQNWYVRDRANRLIVDKLVPFHSLAQLPQYVPALSGCTLPHLNDSRRLTTAPTAAQTKRIRHLYAEDEALRAHMLPI